MSRAQWLALGAIAVTGCNEVRPRALSDLDAQVEASAEPAADASLAESGTLVDAAGTDSAVLADAPGEPTHDGSPMDSAIAETGQAEAGPVGTAFDCGGTPCDSLHEWCALVQLGGGASCRPFPTGCDASSGCACAQSGPFPYDCNYWVGCSDNGGVTASCGWAGCYGSPPARVDRLV